MNEPTDGRTERRTDGRMEGRTGGWMNILCSFDKLTVKKLLHLTVDVQHHCNAPSYPFFN